MLRRWCWGTWYTWTVLLPLKNDTATWRWVKPETCSFLNPHLRLSPKKSIVVFIANFLIRVSTVQMVKLAILRCILVYVHVLRVRLLCVTGGWPPMLVAVCLDVTHQPFLNYARIRGSHIHWTSEPFFKNLIDDVREVLSLCRVRRVRLKLTMAS